MFYLVLLVGTFRREVGSEGLVLGSVAFVSVGSQIEDFCSILRFILYICSQCHQSLCLSLLLEYLSVYTSIYRFIVCLSALTCGVNDLKIASMQM